MWGLEVLGLASGGEGHRSEVWGRGTGGDLAEDPEVVM
jgi:hypothetical protein